MSHGQVLIGRKAARGKPKPPPDYPADCYSLDEFCARFKITRRTFYNLKEKGLAPRHFHIGRHVKIAVADANAWRKRLIAAESAARTAVE